MTQNEYRAALLQLAHISKLLTDELDELGQDLYEAYCTIYESTLKYEMTH